VGDAEGVARNAIKEVTFNGFGRGVGDGVNQTVQTIPMLAEFNE
jgi:hypothetical protein